MKTIEQIINSENIAIEEMIYVVEEYIFERKNVKVMMDLNSGMPPEALGTMTHKMHYRRQVSLLVQYYWWAHYYYLKKWEK